MFPIPWNFPFRKKNGNVVNIQDAINSGGGGGGGSDLPSYDSEDAGKVLSVDNNGELEWSEIASAALEVAEQTMVNLGDLSEVVDGIRDDADALEEALTNEAVTRGSLGAKNLFNYTKLSRTHRGVTFTVNNDGSVTANGTAEGGNAFTVLEGYLKKGHYILNGCPSDGSSSTYELALYNLTEGSIELGEDIGEGLDFALNDDAEIRCNTIVREGVTVSNLTFKPMIRLATDIDPTYQPYSMTNRELTPIAQAVSNRNLLDNPWFTVNQRGQSSYTSGYSVDRWYLPIADRGTITVTNNGITITSNDSSTEPLFRQFIDALVFESCKGKVLTLSIEFADGNIISGSGLIPINAVEGEAYVHVSNNLLNVNLYYRSDGRGQLNINKIASETLSVNIRAVKLELGTVSTLAMDTAPNYAEELLKCQRYFQVIPESCAFRISTAANGSPFVVDAVIPLSVAMRAKPSIIDNGVELDINSLDGFGFAGSSWSIPSFPSGTPYSCIILRVQHTQSTQVSDGSIMIYGKNLELSADL